MTDQQTPSLPSNQPFAETVGLLDPDTAIRLAMAELELLRAQTNVALWHVITPAEAVMRDLSPFGR